MSMLPSQSPGGLFTRPLSGKRVSKRALALILVGVMLCFASFIIAVMSRTGHAERVKEEGSSTARVTASKPPKDLKSSEKPGTVDRVVQYFSPGTEAAPANETPPELKKEQDEFEREIRRHGHQRRMAKLALSDSALAADIAGDSTTSSAVREDLNVPAMASDPDAPVTIQRLPGGGMAIGTEAAMLTALNHDPNMQGRKEAFLNQEPASTYSPYRKEAPRSPYEIKQGTVIPGIMISGINSDLPGQIIAQVSQTVYDTATGRIPLIPQGTRLVGGYDSFVAFGQERALNVWRRMIFPDGTSLELLNQAGADEGGYAGFKDQVNNHYGRIFGGAILLGLIGSGYQLSQPQHTGDRLSPQDIVGAQVGQNLGQVSGGLIAKNMQIQPTIEIRPGYRFNIMVNKDIILEPYVETP